MQDLKPSAPPIDGGLYPGSTSYMTYNKMRLYDLEDDNGYTSDSDVSLISGTSSLSGLDAPGYENTHGNNEECEVGMSVKEMQEFLQFQKSVTRQSHDQDATVSDLPNSTSQEMTLEEFNEFIEYQRIIESQKQAYPDENSLGNKNSEPGNTTHNGQSQVHIRHKEKEGPRSYTNDHDYEKKKVNKFKYRVKYGSPGVECKIEYDDEDDFSPNQDEVKNMTHDEMMNMLYEKHKSLTLMEKTKKTFSGFIQGINNAIFKEVDLENEDNCQQGNQSWFSSVNADNGVTKKDLGSKSSLDLVNDLGCSTIKQALSKKVSLHYLKKCNIDADALKKEGLVVSELQKYNLSLWDVIHTLGIPWKDLCAKLSMNHVLLTRKPQWFDAHALSWCIAYQGADLVKDLGFCLHDIFRLKCADIEIAQLQLDMDSIFKLGMTRQDFLQVPWYPQTMVDMLGLNKRHLIEELELTEQDYRYLIKNRKWSIDFMQKELGFTKDELYKLGMGISLFKQDVQKLRPSDPENPLFDSIHEKSHGPIKQNFEEEKKTKPSSVKKATLTLDGIDNSFEQCTMSSIDEKTIIKKPKKIRVYTETG